MKNILLVLDSMGGRKPGNGVALGICVFKGLFKLLCEILKGFKKRVAEAKANFLKVNA